MSRLDTQQDRLTRGPDTGSARTFIAQPARFQADTRNRADQLIKAVGAAGGTVVGAVEEADKKEQKLRDDADRAAFNDVLRLNQEAVDDPTLIPEYAKQRQQLLDSLPPESALLSQAIKLPTTAQHTKAVEDNLTREHAGVIQKSVSDITAQTFDTTTVYSNIHEARQDVFERTLEAMTPEHKALLDSNQALREDFIRQTYGFANSTYKAGIDARSQQELAVSNNNAFQGAAITLGVSGYDQAGDVVSSLSDKTGNTETVVETQLVGTIADRIITYNNNNSITEAEAYQQAQELNEYATSTGNVEAIKVSTALQNELIEDQTVTVSRQMARTTEIALADGDVSYSQMIADANILAVDAWKAITGLDADTASIKTLSEGSGPSATLAQSFSRSFAVVENNILRLESDNARRSQVNSKSAYAQRRDAQGYSSIKAGDAAGLEQAVRNYGTDPETIDPSMLSFKSGNLDGAAMAGSFSMVDKLSADANEAWVEGDTEAKKWALGNILAYGPETFTHTLRGMDDEDKYGLMSLRKAASAVDLEAVFKSGDPALIDETIQSLSAEYTSGRRTAKMLSGDVGSSPIAATDVEGVTKAYRKNLKVNKEARISDSLTNLIRSTLSQVDLVFSEDMSDKEKYERVSDAITASGKTIYFDGLANSLNVIDDPARAHPISRQVPSKTVANDLRTDLGSFQGLTFEQDQDAISNFFAITGEATGITRGTPLITRVIADDLNLSLTDGDSMSELAATLTAQVLLQSQGPVDVRPYVEMFESSEDDDNHLKLSIGMVGDQPYLIATGVVNGTLRGGDEALLLTEWDPIWASAMGRTVEQSVFQQGAIGAVNNTAVYLADPNGLGAQGIKAVSDAYKSIRDNPITGPLLRTTLP